MSTIDKILLLLEQKDLSQKDLTDYLDIDKSTFSQWKNGKSKSYSKYIDKIAIFLGTTPSYLWGWDEANEQYNEEKQKKILVKSTTVFDLKQYENIKPIQLKQFPVLGEIACGEPIFANEDRKHYIMADMDIDADFCLTAKGDSMINARINNGDIVFIKEMPIVANGDIAAVIINNEATLKRFYYYPEKDKVILNPENPLFEPLIYTKSELNEIRVLGKAVYFMSTL